MLGGTGTTDLCMNDCDVKNELKVSVYNSYNDENQCKGDVCDSTKQTVTVIDGSFLQDVDMLYNDSNGKISMIEVTFDDVFEADIVSSSTEADGSRGTVISLWIWVETTNGMHIFDKIDTSITQFIELSGEIL